MNILMLSDGIPPFVMGGMQKHTKLFVEQLAMRGHQVCLFHYTYQPVDESEVLNQFTSESARNIAVKSFVYKDQGKLPGHYLRAQKKMSKEYFEQLSKLPPFDFIYTKGFMGWYLIENRTKLNYKCKIGVKFHGMNMYQKQANFKAELQKYLLRPPVKFIMHNADVVFSYGGGITKIIENVIRDREKIIELPTAIDSNWLKNPADVKEPSEPRKFLFIGRYDRVKGLPELFQALDSLAKVQTPWEFHFVGPIPKNKRVNSKSCIYHGQIQDRNKLIEIVDSCDILVNGSVSEGMPNVILEAMARGLAIIATDVGATSLLVESNGWLIPNNKPDTLAKALKDTLNLKSELLTSKKQASRASIEKFNWNNIMASFEAAIDNKVMV